MKHIPKPKIIKRASHIRAVSFIFLSFIFYLPCAKAQGYIPADPFHLLLSEKSQFEGHIPIQSNMFRPLFFNTDSISFSVTFRSEGYYNDNAPNQENMDVRYVSKGIAGFNSVQISFNSPYFIFLAEPYINSNKFKNVKGVARTGPFSVLNDNPLKAENFRKNNAIRNFLAFFHYKGLGFGWHHGNRWWGPGIHSSFQMTNNTIPIPSQIIGTMQEVRIGPLGIYGLYSFSKMNDKVGEDAKYFTSLNAQVTWYGPAIITFGFSRNYLSGGTKIGDYEWTESDARKVVFEGFFVSNLIEKEYTIGGHDPWDQTLSGYFSINLPSSGLKLYTELGWNDNTMFFGDFLSQPDHSMATIYGFRDYGIGNLENIVYGFEWINLMITYTSRFRGASGAGTWYNKRLYDYNTYKGRRWTAHSGSDSDDWYIYLGYLSDKLMVIPAFNYERHGIVSHRPAEVKMEFRLDTRYKYKDIWFGIYYEKQFEAFLSFPDYFYVDSQGSPTGYPLREKLANTRRTNTIIISVSKTVNF